MLRTNVVRLAKVVPGNDLDKRDLIAVGNDVLPAGDPEVLITVEDELFIKRRISTNFDVINATELSNVRSC